MSLLHAYVAELRKVLSTDLAGEHSYRSALQTLLEAVGRQKTPESRLAVVNEPKRRDSWAIDYVVRCGERYVGWVETKDIGKDLDRVEKSEQLSQYLKAFPSLLLTNYLEFRWYTDGALREKASLGTMARGRIATTLAGHQEVAQVLDRFMLWSVPVAAAPRSLAVRMASLARIAEEAIRYALRDGPGGERLHAQLAAFRSTILRSLSEDQFADMYAQTLAYGLFAARCNEPVGTGFSRQSAAWDLPKTNPFLREMFDQIAGVNLHDDVDWIVDQLAALIASADMVEINRALGQHQKGREDPIIHFYETFLSEYNPDERKRRGVYYTPEPVVSYIVDSVDHLLKTEFDKPQGLADKNVFVLDPACGTGTFLYFVIEHIHRTITEKQGLGAWSAYVNDHLLRRVFGFEFLMAPYAIAHLKLGMLLRDQGYDFSGDQRLGVYLTNTLEESKAQIEMYFAPFLAREAASAARIKRGESIMVVLGNPPYAGHSANLSEYIEHVPAGAQYEVRTKRGRITRTAGPKGARVRRRTFIGELLRDYYRVDGAPLGERNTKWLQDDYVKFVRFGQWRIGLTGYGILAFVTNHGYLDNPTFRGMRQQLADLFTSIRVLDLHGNAKKRERPPGGGTDKNVFDIQQGVAIGLFSKVPGQPGSRSIRHADLWGDRKSKGGWLYHNNAGTTDWEDVPLSGPLYRYMPQDDSLRLEFDAGWPVDAIFPIHSMGMNTHRDAFVIDADRLALLRKIKQLRDADPEGAASSVLRMDRERTKECQRALRSYGDGWEDRAIRCLYRPFDFRYLYWCPELIDRPRKAVNEDMLAGNLALVTTRQTREAFGALVTDAVCGQHKISAKYDGSLIFPLYRYVREEEAREVRARHPNLSMDFINAIAAGTELRFAESGAAGDVAAFGPEEVLGYIYAVLYSPTYRRRYAGLLRTGFPRIPIGADPSRFARLAQLGGELMQFHLLRHPGLSEPGVTLQPSGHEVVETVRYDRDRGRVYINQLQYFAPIPPEVFAFQIGGHQPMARWLSDRKGKTLRYDDITHYSKVAACIANTIPLMAAIDQTIPAWPIQ
ncbi:MAG: DNA methyltransferase [Armatimonadetes bacterium]|nr:DNA methyltransferase [Armatimonadota bacterium]